MEVIRPFDELLNESLFVGAEVMNPNGTIVLGTAVMGAVAGHPMIKKWMETVEANFQGDDDLYYESSMDVLNKVGVDFQDKMKILPPEYFYPYNHRTGVTEQTDNTICIHKFMKTWTPENLNWHEPRPEEEPGFQYVTRLKNKIVKGENFSFVKRGDGEEMCMSGKHFGEANCDLSTYTPDLALRLQSAFYLFDQNPKAYVLKFDDQKYYNALLHRTDSDLKAVSDFYKVIARSIRKKYFIVR